MIVLHKNEVPDYLNDYFVNIAERTVGQNINAGLNYPNVYNEIET